MVDFLDVINIVGILGTVSISTVTLFTTRSLQRSQQKATIMANKRSERINLMREYSAGIISCSKHVLYGIAKDDTKADLICYTDKFISLLQYEYVHDVELIDGANAIVETCFGKELDKNKLKAQIESFWKMCDVYVGVEYERLKIESMGDINGSGKVKSETKTFEDIYTVLATQQKEYIQSKDNSESKDN